jgi:hypothetical protein
MMPQPNYPQLIAEQAQKLAAITREVADLRNLTARIEHECLLTVITATNEAGKPLHSNETARQAAHQALLYANRDWLDNRERTLCLEQQKAEANAQLERLRGELKLAIVERQARIVERWSEIELGLPVSFNRTPSPQA